MRSGNGNLTHPTTIFIVEGSYDGDVTADGVNAEDVAYVTVEDLVADSRYWNTKNFGRFKDPGNVFLSGWNIIFYFSWLRKLSLSVCVFLCLFHRLLLVCLST